MRIIYVTACLPHGTNEAFVIPEIRELLRVGHEVLVIPRSPKGAILHGSELLQRATCESLYSPTVLKTALGTALQASGRTAAASLSIFGSRSPSVAIKNFAVVPKALWLADTARRWGADHIHCHWAGTTATMAMLASRLSRIPWSLTAHRWDIVEDNLLATKVKTASFVRFISEDGMRMARSIGIGAAKKTRVLHMGVTIPNRPHRGLCGKPVVLCPARLVEVKGHRFLLEAWRILQSRRVCGELWLAGEGNLRLELESLCRTHGLGESVKFLGALQHSELLRLYEEGPVSVVVLASVDLGHGNHEGIPVGLIEAMSFAIPVVATETGGTPELVIPGSGLLVPQQDASALADAIQTLLHDNALHHRFGLAARERVSRAFSIQRVIAELTREFQSAIESRPRAQTDALVSGAS